MKRPEPTSFLTVVRASLKQIFFDSKTGTVIVIDLPHTISTMISLLCLARTESLLHPMFPLPEALLASYTYWEPGLSCEPWLLPSPPVNIDVPGLHRGMNSAPVVAAQLALSYLHDSYWEHTHTFTHGFTLNDCSTSAFVIPELRQSHCFRLSHPFSTTIAELHALFSAVNYMAHHTTAATQCRRWFICMDSRSVLELIDSMN